MSFFHQRQWLEGNVFATRITRSKRKVKRTHFIPRLETLEVRCLPSADIVLQWNAIALTAVKNDYNLFIAPDQIGPAATSRALAIVHAAIYDTVNSIDREFTPYLVDVQVHQATSVEAAVAQTGHDTLVALYPHQTAFFDSALANSLVGISPVLAQRGQSLGHFVATQILAARQNDGSGSNPTYTPGIQPGQWRPDPLHPGQIALDPGWGDVTPFALRKGDQFASPPPPALTSQVYTDAYNEVKSLGGDGVTTPTMRTPEQTIIGLFWSYDGSVGLGVPPREYNQIVRIVAQQQHNSLVQNARLFALVNFALADGGITCWDTKYDFSFWRPIQGIRESDPGTGPTGKGDGNPNTVGDPNWIPLGAPSDNHPGTTNFTPPFPSYTSGHATFGAAMFRILEDFYQRDDISFSFMSDEFNGQTRDQNGNVRPVVTRTFSSFSEAAFENAQSRIYLGIHWSFDRDFGLLQGRQVADYTFGHILRPLEDNSGNLAAAIAVAAPTLAVRTSPIVVSFEKTWVEAASWLIHQHTSISQTAVQTSISHKGESAALSPLRLKTHDDSPERDLVFSSTDLWNWL